MPPPLAIIKFLSKKYFVLFKLSRPVLFEKKSFGVCIVQAVVSPFRLFLKQFRKCENILHENISESLASGFVVF